jgi:uncharacterized lipoprotein YajG
MKNPPKIIPLVAILAAQLLAGCTHPQATAKKEMHATVAEADYEWVYPIGSSIAVKVPKQKSSGTNLNARDRANIEAIHNAQQLSNPTKLN